MVISKLIYKVKAISKVIPGCINIEYADKLSQFSGCIILKTQKILLCLVILKEIYYSYNNTKIAKKKTKAKVMTNSVEIFLL